MLTTPPYSRSMSAIPFTLSESGPSGSWSPAVSGAGPVAACVRHVIDLNALFADHRAGWPDAMANETRRHLAGCIASVEAAIILAARSSPIGRLAGALHMPVAWPLIRDQPALLSPELLGHMRLRAAVSLLAGQSVRSHADPAADSAHGTAWLLDADDPAIVEVAAALAQAEGHWATRGWEGAPMRADLPAEYYAELVWTVTALLSVTLHRHGLAEENAALATMTDAALHVLTLHDEGAGAFALAARLTRMVQAMGQHGPLLGQALTERRYLLFAALAGEIVGTAGETVLDRLVHGSDGDLAALCRCLGGSADDYRHLLLDLQIVRGAQSDPALVHLAERYDAMTVADAEAHLAMLRCPMPLRAKLATIRGRNAA